MPSAKRVAGWLAGVVGLLVLVCVSLGGAGIGREELEQPDGASWGWQGTREVSVAALEEEASKGLPQAPGARRPARYQSLTETEPDQWGSGWRTSAIQGQSQQNWKAVAAEARRPKGIRGRNSRGLITGTLAGTDATVELSPIGDGGSSRATNGREQMLSGVPSWSTMPTATVAGFGMVQPADLGAPVINCMGKSCVQTIPGHPASPGILAEPAHTITDVDSRVPSAVVQQTVEQTAAAFEPALQHLEQEDDARFEFEDSEVQGLQSDSKRLQRRISSLKGEERQLTSRTDDIRRALIKIQHMPRLVGPPGPEGLPGPTGPIGPPGIGIPGAIGLSGPPGKTGKPGADGSPGVQGPQGPRGSVGERGRPGPRGYLGATGPAGKDGPEGKPGRNGLPGSRGPRGPPGLAGLPGKPGPPGMPGMEGTPGTVGVRGPRGRMGAQGLPGALGLQGLHGVDGLDGRPGPQGPPGLPGPSGVSGLPGLHGRAGQAGVPGSMGSPGAMGPPGEIGQEGRIGSPGVGVTGQTGATGVPGVNGNLGTPGANGANGSPGQNGSPGANGAPGAPATPGRDGIDGLPGLNRGCNYQCLRLYNHCHC